MEFADTDVGEAISRDAFIPKAAANVSSGIEEDSPRPSKKSKRSHSRSGSRSLTSKPPRSPSPQSPFRTSTALNILQATKKKSPATLVLPHPASAPPPLSLASSSAPSSSSSSHVKKPFRAPPRTKLELERMNLPIYAAKDEILTAIQQNDNIILIGETGSGKTTQVPQFLLSSGLIGRGQVGCTQPRRVAAISVAQRVAQEYGCTLGAQVGYSIRFEQVTSGITRIKYITDGMLLREIMADPLLLDYNAIVLDEAHERTVNTDILFALLKQIQKKRKRILAARKERDRALRSSPAIGPNAARGKSPNVGAAKSPAKSPAQAKANILSPDMRPLNLEKDTHPPMSKSERRAARQKRKREATTAAEGVETADATKVDESSSSAAAVPSPVATVVPADKPTFILDDDSLPDLSTISNLEHLQELKLVIMSATLSATGFSEYFNSAPILNVPGRTFPVEVLHSEEAQVDYLDSCIVSVLQIHLEQPQQSNADILCFLTGSEEIELARKTIEEKMRRVREDESPMALQVCTLYANLPSDQQMAVFAPAPPNTRKVILATNIAETSLTIPGIRYVIDSGVTKMRLFNTRSGGEILKVVDISQAEAKQRSGRAGRDAPGVAYRLYTEDSFNTMRPDLIPEILRSNLSNVVLQLKNLHVSNILKFDFMTRPTRESLTQALEELYTLRALTYNGNLSQLGRLMVYFPLPPSWSKMVLKSTELEYDCAVEMTKIVSIMSVEGIFWMVGGNKTMTQAEKQTLAQRKQFAHIDGDHFTFLDAFNAYLNQCEKSHNSSTSTRSRLDWCRSHGLNQRNLEKARKVYEQLSSLLKRLNLPFSSLNVRTSGDEYATCIDTDPIKKCLLQGLWKNVARKQAHDASYVTLADSHVVYVHPSSVLIARPSNQRPELIVFNTLVHTTRAYMRDCLVLSDLKWLVELVPEAYGDGSHQIDGIGAGGGGGGVGVGVAPKIKGGKESKNLHERLSSSNSNQSKLTNITTMKESTNLLQKTNKTNKSGSAATPTKKTTTATAATTPVGGSASRPPKSDKKKHSAGGNTRADSLMDFVNAL